MIICLAQIGLTRHLLVNFTVNKHSESAGRALSAITTKMIINNGFPFNVFTLLYEACVISVLDYSAAIYGFKEYQSAMNIHLRAIRSFLGTPKNVCSPGVLSEVDLLLPHHRTKIQMVRFYHRLLCMDNNRLTKKIMLWDKGLNESQLINTWSSNVKSIFTECNLTSTFESGLNFNKTQILTDIKSTLLKKQQNLLKQECRDKPKLRTFLLFKVFDEPAAYVGKPLSFQQRRVLAKARLGCLPLRIETGRYTRLKEEERTCQVCEKDYLIDVPGIHSTKPIENEAHFMFKCAAYSSERDHWLSQLITPDNFENLTIADKFKTVLNVSTNVKATSQFILQALNKRSLLLQ